MTTPKTIKQLLQAARRVSTPLVAIQTPDPAATVAMACTAINGDAAKLRWDVVRGLVALNDAGVKALAKLVGGDADAVRDETQNPVAMLTHAARLPEGAVVFMLQAHRYLDNEATAQAVWNLRDLYKQDQRTLVLLAPQLALPAELAQDVLVLDEPLPTADELRQIVTETYDAAQLSPPTAPTLEAAVDALRGLAAFPAEQVTAMSLSPAGVDVDDLWERKRRMVEQSPGLKVYRGNDTFDAIGGVDAIKGELQRTFAGQDAPRVILFWDEIEKDMAGTQGDNTGVSQAFHGMLLREMEDLGYGGMLFVGPPGAAKSMVAKAAGRVGGVPTISLVTGDMKSSGLGDSEAALRTALKVVRAVGDGRALVIGTCNKESSLSPELKRRFCDGTWFFDLPTDGERAAIWSLYLQRYGVNEDQPLPDDSNWTGAEIRNCVRRAYRQRLSLVDAASTIVPVATIDPQGIEGLRKQATGRFICASRGTVYQPRQVGPKGTGPRRVQTA